MNKKYKIVKSIYYGLLILSLLCYVAILINWLINIIDGFGIAYIKEDYQYLKQGYYEYTYSYYSSKLKETIIEVEKWNYDIWNFLADQYWIYILVSGLILNLTAFIIRLSNKTIFKLIKVQNENKKLIKKQKKEEEERIYLEELAKEENKNKELKETITKANEFNEKNDECK